MTDNEKNEMWQRILCAALTGILASAKPQINEDSEEPFADAAFDAMAYASAVADEALEWDLRPYEQWDARKQVQEATGVTRRDYFKTDRPKGGVH